MSSSSLSLDPVVVPLVRGTTVLDIGCGYGRWGSLLWANYWEGGISKRPLVDGIDAFAPNVAFCSKLPFYRSTRRHTFPDTLKGSWDTVLLIDIIEHIPQNRIDETFDMVERLAKKRVVLATPNWPAYRDGGNTELGYNEYEAHLSYVSRSYLRKRGYTLIGVGFGNPTSWYMRLAERLSRKTVSGSKKNRSAGSGATPDIGASRGLLRRLRPYLEPLARLSPRNAFMVVAYKDVDSKPRKRASK